MTNTLDSPQVRTVLGRLFAAAAHDHDNEPDTITPGWLASASARQRADVLQSIYMPISEQGGRLLYSLVRAIQPATVVEFGTSFGISTIHLAAGVTDVGAGQVLTTELSSAKISTAQANLTEAGLAGVVTILGGDALDTLAHVTGPIDLVFLDGWKDLCLAVLRLLEPRLASGALVVADDAQNHPYMADYLSYVRNPAHGYVTVLFPVEDGMELSCWTRSAMPATRQAVHR
jgi:predicted O-methyltransferase YrrM